MNHSPEPWTAHLDADTINDRWEIDHGADGSVCSGVLSKDDAARIVACVNACRGISTDNLQGDCIKTLVTMVKQHIELGPDVITVAGLQVAGYRCSR